MGVRGMGEASTWARAVARAVSELRTRSGLTVQELASRIDKDPSYLYGRLNGSAPFNINDWDFLARALGVHPIEIARLASKYAALDDDLDLEPTITTNPSELARRIQLLEAAPRTAGPAFDVEVLLNLAAEREIRLTSEHWAQLRVGTASDEIPVRVLDVVAEYTGVAAGYLTDLNDRGLMEATEAQLELRSAIHEVGGESVLARSVGDVSPAGLRAIAASLRAAHRDSSS